MRPQPKYPFVRQLWGPKHKEGQSENGPDVEAVKRGVSRAGYFKWKKFDRAYNDAIAQAVNEFKAAEGIHEEGYGHQTHEQLLETHAVDHEGEWAFDEYSGELFGEAKHRETFDEALAQVELLLTYCETFDGSYLYGGGHGPLLSSLSVHQGLDCSSSSSKALDHVGLMPGQVAQVSGWFEDYGDNGRGKYLTIHCNFDHIWLEFTLPKKWRRFDTSPHGCGTRGPRVRTCRRFDSTFEHRHPRGL